MNNHTIHAKPVSLKDIDAGSKVFIRTTKFNPSNPSSYSHTDDGHVGSMKAVVTYPPSEGLTKIPVQRVNNTDGSLYPEKYLLLLRRGTLREIFPDGSEGEEQVIEGSFMSKRKPGTPVHHITSSLVLKKEATGEPAIDPRRFMVRENGDIRSITADTLNTISFAVIVIGKSKQHGGRV